MLHTIHMEVTKQGNWKRDRCVMLRLNDAMQAEVAAAAAEDRRTVATRLSDEKGEPIRDEKKIGTLYVQKSVFGRDKAPERLSVSVELMS